MTRVKLVCAAALFLVGCGGGEPITGDDDDDAPDAGVDPDAGPEVDDGCPSIYDQRVLQVYEAEIADGEWAALEDELMNRDARIAAGLDPHPYHPIEFRHDGDDYPNVMIRLKGNSSWRDAVAYDHPPKMQFVIAFNEVDPDGRFHGVRKLDLDMPRNDHSFLRQRLALSYLRDVGVPAQCANSARLVINGEYYGLYANLERFDKELLQRLFGHDDADGDLWAGGRDIETNKDTFTWAHLNQFWAIEDVSGLEALTDLEASVRTWAAEAMTPDGDGYYAGRPNFMLYDHPTRGFLWITQDLDAVFDFSPADLSPVFGDRTKSARQHYQILMDDPTWFGRYVEDLADVRASYDPAALEERVMLWAAQIRTAAQDDPMKPFSMSDHLAAVGELLGAASQRAAYIDQWLACRDGGGADADQDGADMCHDCDDSDPSAHPLATELANFVDDDCDGRVDEP